MAKGVLWVAENYWKPSQEKYPLLHHVEKKDVWNRSLPALIPILGNIYVIYQDVRNYLEHRKSVVNERISGGIPHFRDDVRSTKDFENKLRSCGDYGVFSRKGEKLYIAVCLDGKCMDKCIDSFCLTPVKAYGKEYFTLSGRKHFFSHPIEDVYFSLLFPNKDRIVAHITEETCIKWGLWQELHRPIVLAHSGYATFVMTETAEKEIEKNSSKFVPTNAFRCCKIGDLLVEKWPTKENPDGIVHLKISKEKAKLVKIDELRNELKNNTVKGPAVEKFIEIWQRKINALSQPNS